MPCWGAGGPRKGVSPRPQCWPGLSVTVAWMTPWLYYCHNVFTTSVFIEKWYQELQFLVLWGFRIIESCISFFPVSSTSIKWNIQYHFTRYSRLQRNKWCQISNVGYVNPLTQLLAFLLIPCSALCLKFCCICKSINVISLMKTFERWKKNYTYHAYASPNQHHTNIYPGRVVHSGTHQSICSW